MKKPFKTPQPPTEAIAQTEMEIIFEGKTIFSCEKGDTVKFKEIKYDNGGNGHLVINNDVEVELNKFIII